MNLSVSPLERDFDKGLVVARGEGVLSLLSERLYFLGKLILTNQDVLQLHSGSNRGNQRAALSRISTVEEIEASVRVIESATLTLGLTMDLRDEESLLRQT